VIFVKHENQKTLVKGSDAWQLHPEIQPLEGEPVIHKQHGNAFQQTDLQAELASKEIGTLLITGLVTQGCVRATCLGALELGYRVILVSDAHSTYSRGAKSIIQKWNASLAEAGAELITTADVDFEYRNR
jgi:nicotinamidase-related amidase